MGHDTILILVRKRHGYETLQILVRKRHGPRHHINPSAKTTWARNLGNPDTGASWATKPYECLYKNDMETKPWKSFIRERHGPRSHINTCAKTTLARNLG